MLISLLLFFGIGVASFTTYAVLRLVWQCRKVAALRGAAAVVGFVPFAFVGVGMSGLILPEKTLLLGGALVTSTEVGLAVVGGGLGASIAVILFMRFVEKTDFGQIQS